MHKGVILLVEDDTIVAEIAKWRLENLGYAVCGCAASGTEAIDLARKHVPSLVLMDINLKGDMDGIETAKEIKNSLGTPIIYLTSHSDGDTIERARETNPNGFIVKPFEDEDLRVAIELVLKP